MISLQWFRRWIVTCASVAAFLLLLPTIVHADEPPLPGIKPGVSGASTANIIDFTYRGSGGTPIPSNKPSPPSDLPRNILTDQDVETYRAIFLEQRDADWAAADRLIAKLSSKLLMGHVLAQRYLHPTGWRSSFDELSRWLAVYGDHPEARRIHALAKRRQPSGSRSPALPKTAWPSSITVGNDFGHTRLKKEDSVGDHLQTRSERTKLKAAIKHIRGHLARGDNDGARAHLLEDSFLGMADSITRDQIVSEVARHYFLARNDSAALELAEAATTRTGSLVPLNGLIAGLAAWRQNHFERAVRSLEIASTGSIEDEDVIASAYWAARVNLQLGNLAGVREMLEIAGLKPYTFYGLLAQQTLGGIADIKDSIPMIEEDTVATLLSVAAVRRALALAQIDQHHRGDKEFAHINAYARPDLALVALRVAIDFGFPETAYRLAREFRAGYGISYIHGLYPVPPWRLEEDSIVEPALLYAIMRKESAFRARVRSHANARGIMQFLPSTAAYVANDQSLRGSRRHLINDPAFAFQLGHDYVAYLLSREKVDRNLFYMLAAYNGGPGNLARRLDGGQLASDPLLLIETYPLRETREHIKDVVTSYWIYCKLLGCSANIIEAVAAGKWPIFSEESELAGN